MSYIFQYKKEDEKVVCARLLADGIVEYFNGTGFTRYQNEGLKEAKGTLFDKMFEIIPNFNEVCGGYVFLNPEELQELNTEMIKAA